MKISAINCNCNYKLKKINIASFRNLSVQNNETQKNKKIEGDKSNILSPPDFGDILLMVSIPTFLYLAIKSRKNHNELTEKIKQLEKIIKK